LNGAVDDGEGPRGQEAEEVEHELPPDTETGGGLFDRGRRSFARGDDHATIHLSEDGREKGREGGREGRVRAGWLKASGELQYYTSASPFQPGREGERERGREGGLAYLNENPADPEHGGVDVDVDRAKARPRHVFRDPAPEVRVSVHRGHGQAPEDGVDKGVADDEDDSGLELSAEGGGVLLEQDPAVHLREGGRKGQMTRIEEGREGRRAGENLPARP